MPIAREMLARPAVQLAPRLLGAVLVSTVGDAEVAIRLTEVEAYEGLDDPASHAFRGPTRRTGVMFGPAGHLYCYFTYGMHWCANAVCGDEGEGLAVLLRAVAPLTGLEEMRAARKLKVRREHDLCSGPAKLCQAFGVTGVHDGADIVDGQDILIVDDGTAPPRRPGNSVRIGLTAGAEHPWRWFVPGDPNLSRPG